MHIKKKGKKKKHLNALYTTIGTDLRGIDHVQPIRQQENKKKETGIAVSILALQAPKQRIVGSQVNQ